MEGERREKSENCVKFEYWKIEEGRDASASLPKPQSINPLEDLYHYIWKYGLCGREMTTTDGEKIRVVNPGIHNLDAGPDFFNAKIKTAEAELCGNVEIHVKASDWHRHGHQHDVSYDTVILHVVAVNDLRIARTDGSRIPQVCITATPEMTALYAEMHESLNKPGCLPYLKELDSLHLTDWVERLGIERLQMKAERIKETLHSQGDDVYQTLFITLARALGFGLNSLPFEMTAKSIPLNFLMRHSDNLFQLEALLFGQAGMLAEQLILPDEYYIKMCREYYFLRRKYSLEPIRPGLWKYSRTRPQNFPHRRLALLAASLQGGLKLQERLLEAAGDSEKLREIFRFEASEYWGDHSDFGREGRGARTLSKSNIELMLINVAAPFYYAYGSMTGNPELAERGIDLLNELQPERNTIVLQWQDIGLRPASAFQSQALLQLRKEYCERGRCHDCRICYLLLSNRN